MVDLHGNCGPPLDYRLARPLVEWEAHCGAQR